MQKLNFYQDQDKNEFIAILTNAEIGFQFGEDPELRLVDSIVLSDEIDFSAWPTDMLFSQDMNK